MQIGAILRRWIEVLATLYLAWRDSRRELRSLVVTCENQNFIVRHIVHDILRGHQGNFLLTLSPTGTAFMLGF